LLEVEEHKTGILREKFSCRGALGQKRPDPGCLPVLLGEDLLGDDAELQGRRVVLGDVLDRVSDVSDALVVAVFAGVVFVLADDLVQMMRVPGPERVLQLDEDVEMWRSVLVVLPRDDEPLEAEVLEHLLDVVRHCLLVGVALRERQEQLLPLDVEGARWLLRTG